MAALSTRSGAPAPRLVLHFDVNETIQVSDPAGGDDFDCVLDKMIGKTAFAVRRGGGSADDTKAASVEELEWIDGVQVGADGGDPERALCFSWDPPPGAASAASIKCLKPVRDTFTRSAVGARFKPIREAAKARLALQNPAAVDDVFKTDDGGHHKLLPAFFETLRALLDAGRDVSLVIRTFGTDGPAVAAAVRAWAAGRHPTIKPPRAAVDWVRPDRVFRGRYDKDGAYYLEPVDGGPKLAESDAVALLEAPRSATVVQDHYEWWADHGESPSAGKPFWITHDSPVHHIFLDDHIRNDEVKSIVAARVRATAADAFAPLPGAATRALHGLFLVRVPTLEPIRDERWFLERIGECEARRREAGAPLLG